MAKHLVPHADDLALVIDKPTLELLHLDAKTPLEISTDGRVLIVSPASDEKRREEFDAALAKANEKYGPAFRRLAVT